MPRFMARVKPKSATDQIDGVSPDGELLVRVRAIPADGAANEALLRTVAAGLGVPRTAMKIESGSRSRLKRLSVEGISLESLRDRWPRLTVSES